MSMDELVAREALILAGDADGRQIVSLHAKRTYAFDARGVCVLAEDQVPLYVPRDEPRAPWHAEMDVIPCKRTTDVIVHASAHGRGARRCLASVSVGDRKVDYSVAGDRRVAYRGPGSIVFSEPEPFDTIPICYENAYGGIDESAPIPAQKTLLDFLRRHPGAYPRNMVGRGYVITENRGVIEGLVLPNVERPEQLLTPENLIVGAPENWWRQPLPWSCDWFDKSWYPRSSFLAGPPRDTPYDDRELAEVRLGWVEEGQRTRAERRALEEMVDGRYFDAASPSLIVPFLRADERIELTGMTPSGRLVVQLPGVLPRMEVRFEGKTHDLRPRLNRLVVSVDEERLSLVWHGMWHPPRELPDRLPEEGDDSTMELENVEAFIDGVLVHPTGAS
jgi:hypothetical protein